ncbi:MAG: HDOD domain-containing protein, partial [Desulfobacterales bacterium]|nr:HDOD domain-containing protein [Desulfobacterales bacterium]
FKSKGYRIALDDFLYDDRFDPMIGLSSMIKFDLMATPLDSLAPLVKKLKDKYHLTLLAEKVETHDEFEQAKEMGFGLFQGYFFAKPEILSKKEISTSGITKLRLINELGKLKLNLKNIEELIRKDISISFKLLKFINSAYFRRISPINTIKDAMIVLGTDELKKFINVVALSNINDSKPNELIRASVVRARMCELCGTLLKSRYSTEELFTLGLFSTMDALLDITMEEIVTQVSFSDSIREALLGQDPDFKKILFIVKSFEKGNWEHQVFKIMEGKTLMEKLPEFYLDGIKMADSLFS